MTFTAPVVRSCTDHRLLALILALCTALSGCDNSPPAATQARSADTIYTNARVYTVNPDQPWAEAFAVRDGRFVAVGPADVVAALAGDGTKTIDLEGAMVLPGLYDIHLHPRGWYVGEILSQSVLMIPGDAGPDAAAQLIRDFVAANPEIEYLFAVNLPNELFDGEPTSAWLDTAVSDRPAYVTTATGHEAVLNSLAMTLTGIDADTPDPRNGIIERDPVTGEATGYMKEAAMGLYAMQWLPTLDVATHAGGMRDVLAFLASQGITSVRAQHGELPEVEALHQLATSEGLPIRVSVAWTYDAPTRAFQSVEDQVAAIESYEDLLAPRLDPTFVKVNIDGIPTETAAMLEPYLHDENDRGPIFYDAEGLADTIVQFEQTGLRGMVFHNVGDRGARLVLDAMEIAQDRLGELGGRYQLAHSLFISDEDLPRMAELDLTAEFSPVLWFPNPLNDMVIDLIGEERAARMFPMRSVIDAGGRITLASDGPLFMQTPMASVEAAVTRRPPGGGPLDLASAEAITLEEAIAARTIHSAYLDFAEDERGSIETGKLADFVVVDRDLFAIPIEEVSEAQVLRTVVEGDLVFSLASGI